MVTINQAIKWSEETARGWHMPPRDRADAAASNALWHLGYHMHTHATRRPGERWQAYVRRIAKGD